MRLTAAVDLPIVDSDALPFLGNMQSSVDDQGKAKQKFDLKDFSDLGHSPNIEFLVSSMEVHYQHASMQAIKQRALDMLEFSPGHLIS